MYTKQHSQYFAKYCTDVGEYDPIMAGSIDGTDDVPHDKAISRCINAKYKPNKFVVGNHKKTIFVFNLSINTTEDKLKSLFSKYGTIRNCRLVRDIVTGDSKQYAFIEFKHLKNAEDAIKYAHGKILDDKPIKIEKELERSLKNWKPRRLGGGLGGKKESGQLRFGGICRPWLKPVMKKQRLPILKQKEKEHSKNYSKHRI